jgi:hypothetical protein
MRTPSNPTTAAATKIQASPPVPEHQQPVAPKVLVVRLLAELRVFLAVVRRSHPPVIPEVVPPAAGECLGVVPRRVRRDIQAVVLKTVDEACPAVVRAVSPVVAEDFARERAVLRECLVAMKT